MGLYSANTPKRHFAYGNTKMILGLDRGVLRKWKPPNGKKVATAKRYVDKAGKTRWQGTKALRATERLGCFWFHPSIFKPLTVQENVFTINCAY
jgi:hypothetical protein